MKKGFVLLASCCLLAVMLLGCTADQEKTPDNYVRSMPLTPDQEMMLALIPGETQNILLFDYATKDSFTGIELWMELYHRGELVEEEICMKTYYDDPEPLTGAVALLLRDSANISWDINVVMNESMGSSSGAMDAFDFTGYAWGSASEGSPVSIKADEEMVLFVRAYALDLDSEDADGVSKFSGSLGLYTNYDRYLDNETLATYDYMLLLKCRFTA